MWDIRAIADFARSAMNLHKIDLNLLLVFDAVMRERSVTRAAQAVFLTQSAVSSAMSRLRDQLGDDLFVRGPGKLRPTVRALELEAPVRALLADLAELLAPSRFDPATERRSFTIATNDYFTAVLLPALAGRIAREAPGVDLRIVPTGGQMLALLDRQEADLVCTAVEDLPDRFSSAVVVEDEYVCVVRRDHPFARRRPTLAQYADAKHLLVSPRGDAHGFVDDHLATQGLGRRIALTVNQFAAAPQVLAETDCVLTVMRLVAERFAPARRVVTFPCPVPAPVALRQMRMFWHDRLSRYPAHRWLRDCVLEAGQQQRSGRKAA